MVFSLPKVQWACKSASVNQALSFKEAFGNGSKERERMATRISKDRRKDRESLNARSYLLGGIQELEVQPVFLIRYYDLA